jgi:hypothetical protein
MSNRRLGMGAIVVALFAVGVWAGIGSAGRTSPGADAVALRAALAAAKEVPRPRGTKPGASGVFSAGLTTKGSAGTLAWRLTFHGLTGSAIAAHVHMGKPGKAGPIAVALCGPCHSGQRGSAKVDARTVKALRGGTAYVNVHTTRNPGGEIRGQVVKGGRVVAPPSTTSTGTDTTTTTYEPPLYP